ENEVKAAYLANFGKFVQWPAQATGSGNDSFAICILGRDPFGPVLDAAIAGETLEGKKVAARRIARPQDGVGCRIVFISTSEDNQLRETLVALDKASVLTVSDIPQFARRGGMVEFVLQGNKVRFQVNLATAEGTGLALSSQLLKLAVSV